MQKRTNSRWRRVMALVHAWLILDFFEDSRRTGQPGSTLTTAIFGQSFMALVLAALLLPDRLTPGFAVAYATANLSLSTLLISIGQLGDAGRSGRRRANAILLQTAPLGRVDRTLARALHNGFAVSLMTVGTALPPAILMYWVSGRQLLAVPLYLLLACWLAALGAGGVAVALGWIEHRFGRARAALAGGTAKALLLGLGFAAFALCMRNLGGTADDLPGGRPTALAWPPYWASRWLLDRAAIWPFGAALLGLSALIIGLDLWLQTPARSRRAEATSNGTSALARLDGSLTVEGPHRGFAAFTSTMLVRSPDFRAKVLPLFGVPAAMMGLWLWSPDPGGDTVVLGIALQLPAIYLPLVVAFLVHADQPGCRWVFATSPNGEDLPMARHAAWVSVTTHLLLPAHILGGLALLAFGAGPTAAAALASFSLGSAILAAGLILSRLPSTPFTQESSDITIDFGSLLGAALVLAAIGGGFARLADDRWWGPVIGLALLFFAVQSLRRPSR
ncbi:MAG: hypothetical protein AAF628_11015 [Planctomycetota bacterium]